MLQSLKLTDSTSNILQKDYSSKENLSRHNHQILQMLVGLSFVFFYFTKVDYLMALPVFLMLSMHVNLYFIKKRKFEYSNFLNVSVLLVITSVISVFLPSSNIESLLILTTIVHLIVQRKEDISKWFYPVITIASIGLVIVRLYYPSQQVVLQSWEVLFIQLSIFIIIAFSIFSSIRQFEKRIKVKSNVSFNTQGHQRNDSDNFSNDDLVVENEMLKSKLSQLHKDFEQVNANVLLQMKNKRKILQSLQEIKQNSDQKKELNKVIIDIKAQLDTDNKLTLLQENISDVSASFYSGLLKKFPSLTNNERELCAYMKLGLTSKEIGEIRNTTENAINVAKSRLRKKMNLENNRQINNVLFQIEQV
ncbi:helix-turn-helix transcriptional regulator [Flammeovirga agarivorans]|uniref:HTH luxR-type domain-containing protein n=1 Tax=Flammeovirga agarivorans TaxID=2726742 RepID=A0A7X8SM30_9BACT|nr:LuxR C-terminal-related transcriptional regulator [Flammeovirga agarivorans]NLR92651.1 hypothetical protein [Flammeovirga agarivorans]